MKKILLTLSLIGAAVASNAGTTNGVLNIEGTASSSCAISFSQGVNFTLVSGQIPAPGTSQMTLTCNAGASVSALTAASTNGWQLMPLGVPAATDFLPYTLTTTFVTPQYSTMIATEWSGVTGIISPNNIMGAPLTIDDNATPLVADLAVTPSLVPSTLNVGNYVDQVTVLATF